MYLFLINPEAGGKKFSKIQKRAEALLSRYNIKYRFVEIENLADIPRLLDEYVNSRIDGVVAVGGNATVNAVINALVSEDTPVGIVPMSNNNHLAHSLGLHRWDQAIRALADPELKDARLGKIGNHYFVGNTEIASHQNVITKYLTPANPLMKFLGIRQPVLAEDNAVPMQILLDQQLSVVGQIHGVRIDLLADQAKKLRVEILAHDSDKKMSKTVILADEIEAESDKKMPVVIGNETIAHTPIDIRGMSKHIKLLVPKKTFEIKT